MGKSIPNPLYIVKDTYRCDTPEDFAKAFHGWQAKFSGRAVHERLTPVDFSATPAFYPCVVRFSATEGQYRYHVAQPWDFTEGGQTCVTC